VKKKTIRTFSSDSELVNKKRREIAEKAISLFMKKGYLKTTTREIAQICGMSTGGLYHYIGSKEDILSIFSEAAFSILEEISKENFNRPKSIRPREKLKLVLIKYLQWIDEVQDVVLFYYQESKNLPQVALNRVMSSDAHSIKILEEILIEGCRLGEFDVPDPQLAANNIIVLCDNWAFRRWFLRKQYPLEAFIEKQVDFILRAVAGKGKKDQIKPSIKFK
jgi:TetR/AcrR family transcriptional regulator, cholesterol catabolism regulator